MADVLAVLVWALIVLWLIQRIFRAIDSAKGHRNCTFCGTRLKGAGTKWAPACWRCGRMQPWAERKSADG